MVSKITKFIRGIKKESKRNNKYILYSQIIKNERTKRKMTLEEMASGICSISYLCKFEKNDIIADESYIRAIFEKVNLDFDSVGRNILENGVQKALRSYLAFDNEGIKILYDSIDDTIFNAQNYLIKGFYYLNNKMYSSFNNTIKDLDNIKENLLIDDVGVFLFLVIQYYIDTHQYSEANNIFKETEELSFDLDELNWLLVEQGFNLGFYLKIHSQIYFYYNNLTKIDNIAYPYIRKVFTRAKILYIDAKTKFERVRTEFQQLNLKNIPEQFQIEITYWKLITYIRGEKYLECYEEIYSNNLFYDARFLALLLLCASLLEDEDYIDLACALANEYEFDPSDKQDNLFIKFMLLFLRGKHNHEYVDFIKEKILPNRKRFSHFIYSGFYSEKYIFFLRKGSRYKEVAKLLQEILKSTNII